MIQIIIEFIMCMLDVFVFDMFSINFLDRREVTKGTKKTILLTLTIVIFIITDVNLFNDFTVFLNLFIIIMFFSFIYKLNIYMIFGFASLYVCVGILTVFIVNLLNLLPFLTQDTIMKSNILRLAISGLSRGIVMLIVTQLNKHKLKKTSINLKSLVVLFLIFLFINIIFISILFYASYLINEDVLNYIVMVGLCFLLLDIGLIISFYFYLIKLSNENSDLLIKYNMEIMSKINVDIIQQTNENIKRLRHDHKHMMTVISYLIRNGKYEELSKFINDAESIEKSINIVNSGNLIIDSIINSYIQKYPDIDFNCHILISAKLEISPMDLCSIIGNLVSNAAEATHQVQNEKKVNITIKKVYTNLVIDLCNPYELKGSSMDFVTTKINKENHGYGYKSIQSIVEKYDGYMNRVIESNFCHISILLKLKNR